MRKIIDLLATPLESYGIATILGEIWVQANKPVPVLLLTLAVNVFLINYKKRKNKDGE